MKVAVTVQNNCLYITWKTSG